MKINPVENVLNETLTKLKSMLDVDCIIGNPIINESGDTIIPISKATIGFVSGGGEYNNPHKHKLEEYPFAGGSGAGCTISPIGFLIVKKDKVNYINVNGDNTVTKICDIMTKIYEIFKKE